MHKSLMFVLAATGFAAGVPAAQAHDTGYHNANARHDTRHDTRNYYDSRHYTAATPAQVSAEIRRLGDRIAIAQRRGTISKREANALRHDTREIRRTYARYARDGLTRGEVRSLKNRIDGVELALRAERRDRDRRRG